MKVKVIKRVQLIEANQIAIEKNMTSHFKEHNFDDFDEETKKEIYYFLMRNFLN